MNSTTLARTGLVVLAGVVALSVGSSRSSAPIEQGREIARIVGTEQVVVVRTGAEGPQYSLESAGGRVLTRGMTLEELQARHPELYEKIRDLSTGIGSAATGADDE